LLKGKNNNNTPFDKRNNENVIITREFYTNDRKTKFILYNEAQLNDNRLIKITNEIQEIYHSIVNNYKNPNYDWEKEIKIILRSENNISFAKRSQIILYNTLGDNYLLAHELTHTLFGIGDLKQKDFNSKKGILHRKVWQYIYRKN
jgi:hypothetical protein